MRILRRPCVSGIQWRESLADLESWSQVLRPHSPLVEVEGPGSTFVKWGDDTGSPSGEEGDMTRVVDGQRDVSRPLLRRGSLSPVVLLLCSLWVDEARGLPCSLASGGAVGGGGPCQTSVSWQNLLIHARPVGCLPTSFPSRCGGAGSGSRAALGLLTESPDVAGVHPAGFVFVSAFIYCVGTRCQALHFVYGSARGKFLSYN